MMDPEGKRSPGGMGSEGSKTGVRVEDGSGSVASAGEIRSSSRRTLYSAVASISAQS